MRTKRKLGIFVTALFAFAASDTFAQTTGGAPGGAGASTGGVGSSSSMGGSTGASPGGTGNVGTGNTGSTEPGGTMNGTSPVGRHGTMTNSHVPTPRQKRGATTNGIGTDDQNNKGVRPRASGATGAGATTSGSGSTTP